MIASAKQTRDILLRTEGSHYKRAIYPIPDNQEVFRSTVTKTNIIVELVDRLEPGSYTLPAETAAQLTASSAGSEWSTSTEVSKEDLSAVLYHLHDMCTANGDSYEILDSPKPYPVQLIPAPAYTCQALVTSKIRVPDNLPSSNTSAQASSEPPSSGSTATGTINERESTSTCHFFLVRLAQYGTDILVCINVPHDMLEESGVPGAVAQEEMHAHGIMANMMRSLGVVDYGLFGN
ncbi:uncharacterized protein GIQ15_00074 [Arthroderma uncinatum]|uniref:uncharacterized protein n=1 Tax=Arthroderma uncinatum TaxID=74035 RepID=UPI00144AAA19|nr:uncharacterized protein GIQ15_00074 [Arthroderma uncinatum]KAF3490557.1 hypothetical protein GIQ15_00074 [Arthroderma uncinatum]